MSKSYDITVNENLWRVTVIVNGKITRHYEFGTLKEAEEFVSIERAIDRGCTD